MLDKLKTVQTVILQFLAILAIAVLIFYAVINIWGNVAITRANTEPVMPSVERAKYELTIVTTGQQLLTSRYEYNGTVYQLNGFYALNGNRWVWNKNTLSIDEQYWGPVIFTVRNAN